MQNVQGDAAGKILSLPYMLGEIKREGWCMPRGPCGSFQPDGRNTEATEEEFLCFLSFKLLRAATLHREAQDGFRESLVAVGILALKWATFHSTSLG